MNIKEKRENLTVKQKKIISIVFLVAVVLFCGVVTWFIGRPMVEFVSEPQKFRLWVEEHGLWSDIVFIAMVVFQVIIAFVPGEPLEIGGGYAFGAIRGTILCVTGITLGSLLVFLLVRKYGIRFVEIFFSKEKIKSIKFLQNEKRLNFIIFLIFFIPGTPKDLLTYFVGLTDIKLSKFILLASAARLPSVITSTIGGSALGMEDYVFAVVVFAVTIVISGGGLILYNWYSKRKAKK